MSDAVNHYETLGLLMRARENEIKARTGQLAIPLWDGERVIPGYEEKFTEIMHAYDVLTNPIKRQKHDEELLGSALDIGSPIRRPERNLEHTANQPGFRIVI